MFMNLELFGLGQRELAKYQLITHTVHELHSGDTAQQRGTG